MALQTMPSASETAAAAEKPLAALASKNSRALSRTSRAGLSHTMANTRSGLSGVAVSRSRNRSARVNSCRVLKVGQFSCR